jgi:peptidoglycan/xylan/chitin deacetylase (PgdA/CDA1 family)
MTHKLPLVCVLLGLATITLVGPSAVAPEPARLASSGHPTTTAAGVKPSQSTKKGGFGQAARQRAAQGGAPAGPTATRQPDPRQEGSRPSGMHRPDLVGVEELGIPGAPAGRPVGNRLVVQRRLDTHQVALTFDDGPDAATPQILALLRDHGVKATFCVIGVNVQAHPDLVRQIVADGHSLCNHTWKHDLHLGAKPAAAIQEDLQKTSDEIHKAVPGVEIRYFRHPGGNFTEASSAVAKNLGMISIGWDVDPNDWNLTKFPAAGVRTGHIVNVVTAQAHPGAIILSHDGGGDRSATIAAYQQLLPWLRARFELVALPT